MRPSILTVNAGSSSLRFAIYEAGEEPRLCSSGKVDRIDPNGFAGATDALQDWLGRQPSARSIVAVGHRVVHGMKRSEPERVTARLLKDLRRIRAYDPDHLPNEITLIETLLRHYPEWMPVACFDTAFHHAMPSAARLLPLPRRYIDKGIVRYGFHGLSYSYLMEELRRLDPRAANGRLILAHLGNGASIAAVHRGKPMDTSMSFTSAAGLVMGTRAGDIDPGLLRFFMRTGGMSVERFDEMITRKSGLLGLSGTTADVRDLLAKENHDPHAAEALEVFCYQARKWIGSFAAVLGGIDTLVFTAGIGENAPEIRRRICQGLGFLGIELDQRRNTRNAAVISRNESRVTVRVIRTNEEIVIARYVSRMLRKG
jgi:acetate kinase